MTLKETLKYMESQVHLQEANVDGVNNVLNHQGLTNEIKIQQGQGNDVIINGIKYPGDIGQKALNKILKKTHPDYNKGLNKDQILQNVITATAEINKGSIGKSIRGNMNSSQSANSNQNLPANQDQNQIVVKQNGKVITPTPEDIKAIQDSIQKNGLEQTQQTYQQQGYTIEFTPPTQLEDNRAETQALPPPQESINELSTEVNKNTPALINTEIPNFDKFNELSNLLNNDLNKISDSLDGLIKSLSPSLQNNPQAQQAIQQIEETKKNDKTWRDWKGWSSIGNFLKGALNTVAGMAGNFIGGIASGMGAK